MAIGTPVERRTGSNAGLATSPFVISPTTTVQAGTRAILVFTSGASKSVTAVTDSVGNTWTVDHVATDGTRVISFASCQVATQITSSNTISITLSNTTNASADYWIQQVSGLATSSAFDQSHDGSGSASTAANSGNTATLAQADEFVFGASRTSSSTTWAKGTGYTDVTTPSRGSTSALEYKIVSATSAVSATGTWGANGNWVATVVTYKGAAAVAVVSHARPLASPLRHAMGPLGA